MRILAVVFFLLCAIPSYGFNFDWSGSVRSLYEDLVQSLSWSTSTYEFGSHDVGTTTSTTFIITNSGNDTAEDVATTVTGAGFRLYSSVAFGNISAGKNRTAKVAFTPTGAGEFGGFANYSAPNIGRTGVALSGTGVGTVATVYYDDFNREDGVLGANWTKAANSPASLTIATNAVSSGTFGNDSYGVYTGFSFANNQYAQVALGASAIDYGGVACRMNTDGDGYLAACVTNTNCRVYKVVGGVKTNLGATPPAVASAYGKTLRLNCNGATLSATLDGVEYVSRTDSTFASGYAGIWNKSTAAGGRLDNFEAGDL